MKILYATDRSPASEAAAALLEAVGRREDAELSVVSVLDAEPSLPEAYAVEGEVLRTAREHAREVVDKTADRLTAAGFSVDGDVL